MLKDFRVKTNFYTHRRTKAGVPAFTVEVQAIPWATRTNPTTLSRPSKPPTNPTTQGCANKSNKIRTTRLHSALSHTKVYSKCIQKHVTLHINIGLKHPKYPYAIKLHSKTSIHMENRVKYIPNLITCNDKTLSIYINAKQSYSKRKFQKLGKISELGGYNPLKFHKLNHRCPTKVVDSKLQIKLTYLTKNIMGNLQNPLSSLHNSKKVELVKTEDDENIPTKAGNFKLVKSLRPKKVRNSSKVKFRIIKVVNSRTYKPLIPSFKPLLRRYGRKKFFDSKPTQMKGFVIIIQKYLRKVSHEVRSLPVKAMQATNKPAKKEQGTHPPSHTYLKASTDLQAGRQRIGTVTACYSQ